MRDTLIGQGNPLAIAFFLAFVASTLAITWWAAKRTRSTSEFYAAGRSVTGFQNGLALAVGLIVLSPTVWVDILGNAAAPFPLRNPGLFSMAGGFLAAVIASLLSRERAAEARWPEQKLRSYVGVGAE